MVIASYFLFALIINLKIALMFYRMIISCIIYCACPKQKFEVESMKEEEEEEEKITINNC